MIAVVFGGPHAVVGEITFQSDRDADGDWEIFIMDDDGTNQNQLTFNTDNDYDPRFSFGGAQIVFRSSEL